MLSKNHLLSSILPIGMILLLTLLQPVLAQTVGHVVIISFDGLRADALSTLGASNLPTFYHFIQNGASTLNARNDYHRTVTLPNHATMLTGRGVIGSNGHEFDLNSDDGQVTLHSNKGSYLSSLIDVAHDHGLKTALIASKDKFEIFSRSYDQNNGAVDINPIGGDNGQNKIDIVALTNKVDPTTRDNFLTAIAASQPPHLTFLHFAGPDKIGHTDGWDITPNSNYLKTVEEMDGYLQEVLDNIPPSTVVIAASDHGGGDPYQGHHNASVAVNYTIPFLAWDNIGIIEPGCDLYELNQNHSDYEDPGITRPDYNQSQQPIRNGDAANLALSLLNLPSIPGSTMKGTLALNKGINTAPQLNNSSDISLTAINEDEINNAGTLVSDLITGLITDPDPMCHTLTGIAVIAVDNNNGTWEYSIDNGSTWNAFGNPTPDTARLLASDTKIRFIPNPQYFGTVQSGITFRAWDQTTGSHGSTADTTRHGDTTAFSSNTETASITVNAVNDAPSFIAGHDQNHVDGTSGNQTISHWATAISPGAANESTQLLTFQVTITSDSNHILTGMPTIESSTGDLNYMLTGHNGTAQLAIVLIDDGGTAHGGIDTASSINLKITVGSLPKTSYIPVPTVPLTASRGLQPLPPTMKLSMSFRGKGKGRVTTDPLGLDCDSSDQTCEHFYDTASWITFTAIAAPGSRFNSWGGHSDCNNGEVFMNGYRRCTAYFDLVSQQLTVTPVEQGIITSYPPGINCSLAGGPCSYRFNANTEVTLTVIADSGWQVSGWEGDCNQAGQVNLTKDQHCQPIITPIHLPLTVEIRGTGAGSVTHSPTGLDCGAGCTNHLAHTDVTLTARAADHSTFTAWTGDCHSNQNPLVVKMDKAFNCQAHFELLPLPMASQPNEANEVAVPPETTVSFPEITTVLEKPVVTIYSTPEPSPTTVLSTNYPLCPTAGWLDWVCNAQQRTITELAIGPNGNLSNGVLIGTILNQGWVSNLTIQPQAVLSGGVVTGYINNQGIMTDFEFRGAQIQGGILSGIIINNSPINGLILDVKLAADTYLSGGKLGGQIMGEPNAPAWLEYLEVQADSYLNHVIIGEGVELTEPVTLGENIRYYE